jgi:hypothetical protein
MVMIASICRTRLAWMRALTPMAVLPRGPTPLRDKRAAAMRRSILGHGKLGSIPRNIIKLWYIGAWFALLAAWQERFGPADADGTFVVAPTAYIERPFGPIIS